MTDHYGRTIEYLRLSVTDLCNFRCRYCMEKDGVEKKCHSDILSIEALSEIANTAVVLGVKKIRLTGGEPLLRKGILSLCENIKRFDKHTELSLTTNGSLLKSCARALKDVGVDRLNISLDTLNEEKFSSMTRCGSLKDALDGIEAALSLGFSVKINTVLIGGFNTDEINALAALTKNENIQVRFIELMPMPLTKNWEPDCFVKNEVVLEKIQGATPIGFDGVARLYQLPDGGVIGLISPLSHSFCAGCNRIRVTADGKLKPCLHSCDEIDLKGLSGDALKNAILEGVSRKPKQHSLSSFSSFSGRDMNEIGG